MIVAAIVCAAAMSQAASIAWGNGTTSKIVGLDGSTAISAANWASYNMSVQLMLVGKDEDKAFASAGKPSTMTAGVITSTATSYEYGTDAKNGDLFYILCKMTVDGKDYEMKIDNAGSNWALAATDSSGADSFTWAAGTYGGLAETATVGKWSVVPEPTSGLLLLLGVAGLALKRKRA